jgi:hypothetical protein
VLLPKFAGPRADLFPRSAPLQLLPQFLNEPPEALRRRLVADVGSEPLCSFDLALQFVRIFIVIHGDIHPGNARKIAQSSSKPPIIWRSA